MLVNRLLKRLLLPPSGPLLAATLGLGMLLAARIDLLPEIVGDAGLGLALLSLVSLWLLCTPAIARRLLGRLDRFAPLSLDAPQVPRAEAIVVLDAGGQPGAAEYHDGSVYTGSSVAPMTLERLRYAAWLQHRLQLPLTACGDGAAEQMRTVLEREFSARLDWLEVDSRNTQENAFGAARLLRPHKPGGVRTILLVTHFWHLPRAVRAFRRAGFEVVPAPTGLQRRPSHDRTAAGEAAGEVAIATWLLDWLPRTSALDFSYLALHELVGSWWYRLYYRA